MPMLKQVRNYWYARSSPKSLKFLQGDVVLVGISLRNSLDAVIPICKKITSFLSNVFLICKSISE